jgi:hypothetical protein
MNIPDEIIKKAEWLIEHGYADGDILEIANIINNKSKKEDAPTSSSSKHIATEKE